MEFSEGAIVRLRKDVDKITLEKEGVPIRLLGIPLVVVKRGRDRNSGRRYRVMINVRSMRGPWWLPGYLLMRDINCMFNKEV